MYQRNLQQVNSQQLPKHKVFHFDANLKDCKDHFIAQYVTQKHFIQFNQTIGSVKDSCHTIFNLILGYKRVCPFEIW